MGEVVQFPKTEFVEKLEELLDQARRHEIVALAVVVVSNDVTETDYLPRDINKLGEYSNSIIAGTADIQFRLQAEIYGVSINDDNTPLIA